MFLTQGLHALARRQEMLCTLNFFYLISHDQLLTELRIKINLDKYSNFTNKAAKGCLVILVSVFNVLFKYAL